MTLKDQFTRLARYNRWANERLFGAVGQLSAEEFHAARSGFFGSLCGTLNHLYVGDRCWLARFEQIPVPHQRLDEIPHPLFEHLWAARQVEDRRIERLIDEKPESWFNSTLNYIQVSDGLPASLPMDIAVLHFFNHQTHHRGQAHAMLSSTAVAPPPLDLDDSRAWPATAMATAQWRTEMGSDMSMKDQFARLARYNRWANERLFGAVGQLSATEFHAARSGFFGSLCGTLNHLYVGDRCWLARFEQIPVPHRRLDEIPHPLFEHLWAARQVEDRRIERLIDEKPESWFNNTLSYVRISDGLPASLPMDVAVLHFFNHQTHHRGQAHAMLSSTTVAPPPLDLGFFYSEDTAR